MSDEQWGRKANLIISDKSGNGLDLSEFHFTFQTRKGDIQTPNSADIRVYNLAEDTVQRVQKEFSRVILQAGYTGLTPGKESNYGVIFQGNVKQFRRGRESATDTYLDILAGDGDQAYNFAVVNKSLAAGASQMNQVQACAEAMAPMGTGAGYLTPDLDGPKLPRGKVMFGDAKSYLRAASRSAGASWSIQDEQLTVLPLAGVPPGQAVDLTSKTGLVGMPEQTENGINARCLLNPRLKIGARVHIDQKSIQRARLNIAFSAINWFPKVTDDGFYRVLICEHVGDTRGNDWYSNLVCVGINEMSPQGLVSRGIA